jgi:UDP-N-acetylmuramoyl-L-alanyl-D-glutamate--2,6-diaminopimelate ligase
MSWVEKAKVHVETTRILARLASQGAMIERLSSDSRRCAPGVAFLAYPGAVADGRAHIADAIRRGASAILWDDAGFDWRSEWRVPNVAVRGLKQCAGMLAHEFYGQPSESLWVCGVTGTNGKTSSSQWIAAALCASGTKAGVIGTLGAGFPGALAEVPNTTPDALEVHALLKKLLVEGGQAVAMEVSSHGLAQGRVNGVAFDCALFTNLSHDHLDYHRSMEAYAEAKARLFDSPGLSAAVINLDDVIGVQLVRRLEGRGVRIIGYSLSGARSGHEFIAAVRAAGGEMDVESSWGRASVRINQIARFSMANALGVLGCLLAFGLPFERAMALLAELPAVPGRMEQIGTAPLAVVDYAHTPDALEKVLQALRPVAAERGGKLVVVFGAGGDRDPAKRPLMGAVAARLADLAIVTSDNPRSEDPLAIIRQIEGGMEKSHLCEADRARAIQLAIAQSDAADVILVAGKGHEGYQEIRGERLPFSDAQAVRAALAKRGAA